MKIRLDGEVFIAASIVLLLFYQCVPISLAYLSSLMIRTIVLVSSALFLLGMVMLNRWSHLLSFLILFALMCLYWRFTWSIKLETLAYVYYCFAGLVFLFGGLVLYNSTNEALVRRLFLLITVIFLVTSITTIIGLNIYPLAARELGRPTSYDPTVDAETYRKVYRSINIAGWGQVYGMLFGIPVSIMVWKRRRKPLFLVLCILLSVLMVLSQLTFAVLLATGFIVASLMITSKKKRTIAVWILFFVAAVIFLTNMDYFLTLVVNWSKEAGFRFLTLKLNDLRTLLVDQNAVGDASERSELYGRSIETFLNDPLFGLLLTGQADPTQLSFHSEFLDIAGGLGIIGLSAVIISFVRYFSFIKKIGNETKKYLIIIFAGFIILFILNPVFHSPPILAGAFLYPLLASKYCSFADTTDTELKNGERL